MTPGVIAACETRGPAVGLDLGGLMGLLGKEADDVQQKAPQSARPSVWPSAATMATASVARSATLSGTPISHV